MYKHLIIYEILKIVISMQRNGLRNLLILKQVKQMESFWFEKNEVNDIRRSCSESSYVNLHIL